MKWILQQNGVKNGNWGHHDGWWAAHCIISQVARCDDCWFWLEIPVNCMSANNICIHFGGRFWRSGFFFRWEIDVVHSKLFAMEKMWILGVSIFSKLLNLVILVLVEINLTLTKIEVKVYLRISGLPFKAIHQAPRNVALNFTTILLKTKRIQ